MPRELSADALDKGSGHFICSRYTKAAGDGTGFGTDDFEGMEFFGFHTVSK